MNKIWYQVGATKISILVFGEKMIARLKLANGIGI